MKVTFIGPIAAIRGSLSKDSDVYFKQQYGKTVLAHKPRRTAKYVQAMNSPKAKAIQNRFTAINRMAAEIMKTTVLRESYEQAFRQQKNYTTLRGYIVHCLSQEGRV